MRRQPTKTTPQPAPCAGRQAGRSDNGSTYTRLVLVMVACGILAVAAAIAIPRATSVVAGAKCATDRHQLLTAAAAYLTLLEQDEIPATGADGDRYERTLSDNGFLSSPSQYYDLGARGALDPEEGSPCVDS